MSYSSNYNPPGYMPGRGQPQPQPQQQPPQHQNLGIGLASQPNMQYAPQPNNNMRAMGIGRGVAAPASARHALLQTYPSGSNYATSQQDLLAMLNRPQGAAAAYNPQPRASAPVALTTSTGALPNNLTQSSSPTADVAFDMSSFPALAPVADESTQELNLVGDDFPALGGRTRKDAMRNSTEAFPQLSASPTRNNSGSGGSGGGAAAGSSSNSSMHRSHDDLRDGGAQPDEPSAADVNDASQRFSLLGLLSVIRMADADRNTLALGTDLTTLGLNLNSSDTLYSTFTSPFAEQQAKREPEFYLPACYYMQPPMQPAQTKIANFSDEILFYIFYSNPNDAMQVYAAVELYGREWRYHKEHKLWFIRAPGGDHTVQNGAERGSYFFFDVQQWEKIRKDDFTLQTTDLEPKPTLPLTTGK